METVEFKIRRFVHGKIDPPRDVTYRLAVDPHMSVLDALEKIRLTQEPSLMYRHSCHHSSCGTCACLINDTPRLTCITKVSDLKTVPIHLAPLSGFECEGDLVVRMAPFFEDLDPSYTGLRNAESIAADAAQPVAAKRFENCIECGNCVAACPVSQGGADFMGPAVLAAINRQRLNCPAEERLMLALADGTRGVWRCTRALACSRVCPTAAYPARHIADLRRILRPDKDPNSPSASGD